MSSKFKNLFPPMISLPPEIICLASAVKGKLLYYTVDMQQTLIT